ncbi:RidA family protein [Altererythrobacter sp. CC-YST694]|uniref:Rid family hydrolase n=1 Tax=Altererythrobacter sp. CC-YST694 TaxID=2755038 RepID=UPI001D008BF1|nr:Rid family hydrolase [Altererythrobacter sp. CC-YST694]MCB5426058.1 RidA family protein [Altererythrobacter sp. CC-YST694]
MSTRQRISPRSKFEESVGFTRALRDGNRIIVAGTIDDRVPPAESAGDQADRIYTLIGEYIEELGGSMADVVRVRMFVTDIADADAVSAAFSKHLKAACPTGTLVAIAALYRPEYKVEIEAEAVVRQD